MASEWLQLTLRQLINGVSIANVFDYIMVDQHDPDAPEEICNAFDTNTLADINAIQIDEVQNTSLYCLNRTDARYSFNKPLTGGGDIVAPDAEVPIQTLALYSRLVVGNTHKFSDGSQITARTIKRGGKYFAGLTDSAMSLFILSGVWLTTERATLRAQIAANLVLASTYTAFPIVYGKALAATPTKGAREECYAQISSVSDVSVTSVGSRKT